MWPWIGNTVVLSNQVLEVGHSAEVAGPAVPQRRNFARTQLQEPALRRALTQSVLGVRQRWVIQQHLDTESALLATLVTMWPYFRAYEWCQLPCCGLRFRHCVVLREHTGRLEVLRVCSSTFRITGLRPCLAVYRAQVTVTPHDAPSWKPGNFF